MESHQREKQISMDWLGRQNDKVDELAKNLSKNVLRKIMNRNLLNYSTKFFHFGLKELNNQMSAKESCMKDFDVKIFLNIGKNTMILQFQVFNI